MARALRSLAMVLGLGISLLNPAAAAQSATLRWFGHAFFLITSSQGVRVALDPFGDIGYPVPEVAADVVTVSHEHGDHNVAQRLAGSPAVLRGLKAGGVDWNPVSYDVKDVRITALPAYHDNVQGRRLGLEHDLHRRDRRPSPGALERYWSHLVRGDRQGHGTHRRAPHPGGWKVQH